MKQCAPHPLPTQRCLSLAAWQWQRKGTVGCQAAILKPVENSASRCFSPTTRDPTQPEAAERPHGGTDVAENDPLQIYNPPSRSPEETQKREWTKERAVFDTPLAFSVRIDENTLFVGETVPDIFALDMTPLFGWQRRRLRQQSRLCSVAPVIYAALKRNSEVILVEHEKKERHSSVDRIVNGSWTTNVPRGVSICKGAGRLDAACR